MRRHIGLSLSVTFLSTTIPQSVSLLIHADREARPRIAVLTSGLLDRFMFTNFTTLFLDPMIKAGYDVDYYATLATFHYGGWSNDTAGFTRDPMFDGLSDQEVGKKVRGAIESHGGKVRTLKFPPGVELDVVDDLFVHSPWMFRWGGAEHAQNTRGGVIKHWKGVYHLFQVLKHIENELQFSYKYVMYHRDDFLWIHPFDIGKMLAAKPILTAGVAGQSNLYTHRCDPNMTMGEWKPPDEDITESMMTFERAAAASVLERVYAELRSIPKDGTIETLLARLVKERGDVHVHKLPAALIPGQKVGYDNIELSAVASKRSFCLHYRCNSRNEEIDVMDMNGWKACM